MRQYDIKITNGTIYDGDGGAPWCGDIAIKDGLIVAVGDCPGEARETIDAAGHKRQHQAPRSARISISKHMTLLPYWLKASFRLRMMPQVPRTIFSDLLTIS